jgi:hypothetical protein
LIGIIFKSNADDTLTIIANVARNPVNIASSINNINVYQTAAKNDILIAVNGRIILNDEPSDVADLLEMIRLAQQTLRLKFLRSSKLSLKSFLEMMILDPKKRLQSDLYGFHRSVEYVNQEKKTMRSPRYIRYSVARDVEWVEYMKSIGGADNLKPASGNLLYY